MKSDYNARDLQRWLAHIYELEPGDFKGMSDDEMLWDIAHALIVMCDNYQTAAHVVTGLIWTNAAHRPHLESAVSLLKSLYRKGVTCAELRAAYEAQRRDWEAGEMADSAPC